MKKRLNVLLSALLFVLAAVWALDTTPFTQHIDQQIEAMVYRDGVAVDTATVLIRGDKTRYLFREDSFVGEFRIPYVASTDIDGLQTQIRWYDEYNYQHISHFYKGDFFSATNFGLVNILLISEDLDTFALMTTDGKIIATSDEFHQLYTDHIFYYGNGKVGIPNADAIPVIS